MEGGEDEIIRIGLDASKHVFQLHGVNGAKRPVLRQKLRWHEKVAFLETLPPAVVAIEACGASHPGRDCLAHSDMR
jgi:transposase